MTSPSLKKLRIKKPLYKIYKGFYFFYKRIIYLLFVRTALSLIFIFNFYEKIEYLCFAKKHTSIYLIKYETTIR